MIKDYIIWTVLDFRRKFIGEGGYMMFWDDENMTVHVKPYVNDYKPAKGLEYIPYEEFIQKINEVDRFTVIDGITIDFNEKSVKIIWH